MPSDMDDPDIIATLIATGSDLAKRAFQFDHNRQRYLPPIHANDVLSSRENTPVISEETDDDGEDDEYEHRLVLSFRSPPKDPARGFVFGAGSECDVKLADRTDIRVGEKRKIRRISQVHFSIGFDAYRRVVLQDTSVNGTIVSYDGHAQKESRTNFLWIIAPGWKTIEISIPGAELAFQIQLGIHETCEAAFLANVDTHFPTRMGTHERSLAYPMLQLGVQSRDTSVATSGAATPRRGPIYLLRGEIGRGTFGRVYKVVDVSSGAQYAGKTFEGSRYEREVAILRSLKHEHIVPFIDFRAEPTPLLVMDYFPLGNLEHLLQQFKTRHGKRTLPIEDAKSCSSQLLEAVAHAHAQRVVHRDIKPANALISCIDPLEVKLADFGLAKGNLGSMSMARSFLGTHLYAAPEVYDGAEKPYSYPVDIWSLGVVMLEISCGLPRPGSKVFNPSEWHQKVRMAVTACGSDDMAELLSQHMLQYQPEERLPAHACLEKVNLLKQSVLPVESRAGSLTPTEPASVLSTRIWAPESSNKRRRSLDSNGTTESDRRRICAGRRNDLPLRRSFAQTYVISKASLFYSGDGGPVYENVLELLKELQLGGASQPNNDYDSHTVSYLRALCGELQRLHVVQIQKSFCDSTEQTILTATTDDHDFILASLTSSDLENSVAHLAEHLTGILLLRSLEHKPREDSSANPSPDADRDATVVFSEVYKDIEKANAAAASRVIGGQSILPSSAPQDPAGSGPRSTCWSTTDASESPSLFPPHQRGLTYPSSLSDPIKVSGCTPPSSSIGVPT